MFEFTLIDFGVVSTEVSDITKVTEVNSRISDSVSNTSTVDAQTRSTSISTTPPVIVNRITISTSTVPTRKNRY